MISILIHSLLLISPAFGYGTWSVGTNTLPLANSDMAACQDNNGTVYLLGGWNGQWEGYGWTAKSFVSFKNGEFSDYGDILTGSIFESSQYFSQLNENLWLRDYNGNAAAIYQFDVNTLEMTYDYALVPGEQASQATMACLASVDSGNGYLITMGGRSCGGGNCDELRTVSILDLATSGWTTTALLNVGREDLSCTAVNDVVYVIGGTYLNDTGTWIILDSIEMALFSDLLSEQESAWSILSDTLLAPLKESRAVMHSSDILVIGGESNLGVNTEVNVIDTLTNTVSSGGNLNYGVRSPAAIIVDNMLYVFGGNKMGWLLSSDYTDNYQYLALPTESPTIQPTKEPTMDPTNKPTMEPTSDPTSVPTSEVTLDPTSDPTSADSGVMNETTNEVATPSPVDVDNSDFAVNNFGKVGMVLIVLMAILMSF